MKTTVDFILQSTILLKDNDHIFLSDTKYQDKLRKEILPMLVLKSCGNEVIPYPKWVTIIV
ncbi:hypothetical protein [Streptococcus uberis]|uniref:hypothetical protein n=1 Tax=Streptococcus uberis TaxID=1349 RepID=UPI0027DD46AB|nr:hypothetical protein [Streptococcus uberis]